MRGQEFPERQLMSILSDLLGIRHFTTSRGSTVRKDFLLEVAREMNIQASDATVKEDLIRLIWEGANQTAMPSDRLSVGGTVTNQVLQDVIDGIIRNGLVGFSEDPENYHDHAVDFAALQDERKVALRETAIREGQDSFRREVMKAYHTTCTVTGTDVPAALEAAHIVPYHGPNSNDVANGLCLRKDIHALFDRGMLTVHEHSHQVLLAPVLLTSSSYSELQGHVIRLPRNRRQRPDSDALQSHRRWAGLGD